MVPAILVAAVTAATFLAGKRFRGNFAARFVHFQGNYQLKIVSGRLEMVWR
jgi:hypothetical protein